MDKKYNITMYGCFIGYIVQAIINNFIPLLFLTFSNTYHIPMSKITLLITLNFGIQLTVDFIATKYVDKIGYRASMLLASCFAFTGLVLLAILPNVLNNAFVGILICVILYALGGGLLEVVVSPIMESTPSENKEKAMSLLHSFYCIGHIIVIVLSTIYFNIFGVNNWMYLSLFFSLVPLTCFLIFLKAPLCTLLSEEQTPLKLGELLKNKLFWIIVMMMICAGATELTISQWASTFVESSLGISKTYSDLVGPLLFAFAMALSRFGFGKLGHKINLNRFMSISIILCLISYILIAFTNIAYLSLFGCALCGFGVGILWPGTFSKAVKAIPLGGTTMFALLAVAGDIGCMAGPTVTGFASEMFGGNLQLGIGLSIIFPALMIGLFYLLNHFVKE